MKVGMYIKMGISSRGLKQQSKSIQMILDANTDEKTKRAALLVLGKCVKPPKNISIDNVEIDGSVSHNYPVVEDLNEELGE